MSYYGRGIDDLNHADDLYFVDEKTEVKQGGFQTPVDFKNKFSIVPIMGHFKGSPRMIALGSVYSYGMTETGELMMWLTEEDKSGKEGMSTFDLKSLAPESREGLIGKTANLAANLTSGLINKDRVEVKRYTIISLYCTPRGDFCIICTLEGDLYCVIARTRTIEYLPKLKRTINALKFLEVNNEDERSYIKFVCTAANGFFSYSILDFRFKVREAKGTKIDSFEMAASELNQCKANSMITKIDVGWLNTDFQHS